MRAKPFVIAAGLIPAAALVVRAATDQLGANPIEEITHETGEWGLRFLLASLAVTPLRTWAGWKGLASYRRTFGLFAFFYASLHLSTWAALDLFFDWQAIVEDVIERPFVTAGMVAFLCMLPLAVTSTRGWVRRLGRRWVTLHRLAYLAGIAAVVHFLWLVKADLREPLIYGGVLALLLAARVAWNFRRTRKRRRKPAKTAPPADEEDEPWQDPEEIVVPIESAIDLHTFAPRDIPGVVRAYLEAAVEAGFAEVRLIHGKGKGVQRDRVQEILAESALVERYEDAPPERGGWGATLAWLRVPSPGPPSR